MIRTYMFVGAHPDDADIQFAGTAILLKQLGHKVVFVSVTDGSAGHHELSRDELAKVRLEETKQVAHFLDIRYEIVGATDGGLAPDLATREQVMRVIRKHKPDVIVTPRPNDYHADHRATALLVQDCSFLLTVPLVCPDVPALENVPYIFFHQDAFSKPNPFTPEIVVDISPVLDQKMEALSKHESQMFGWLPWIERRTDPAPTSHDDRIEWLKKRWGKPVEAFERCEYGAPVTTELATELFPFAKVKFDNPLQA